MDRCAVRGFSLIEILVVVTLLALTVGMAVPSLSNLIDRNRALALADQLQSQLAHARALSVSRNRDVEICGSSDGEHCDGGWDRGWLLRFQGETQPFSRNVLKEREQLRLKTNKETVRFHGNGTSPLGNATFSICGAQARGVLQVVINRQGRVQRKVGSNAACS